MARNVDICKGLNSSIVVRLCLKKKEKSYRPIESQDNIQAEEIEVLEESDRVTLLWEQKHSKIKGNTKADVVEIQGLSISYCGPKKTKKMDPNPTSKTLVQN